jgi:hypothetical protein
MQRCATVTGGNPDNHNSTLCQKFDRQRNPAGRSIVDMHGRFKLNQIERFVFGDGRGHFLNRDRDQGASQIVQGRSVLLGVGVIDFDLDLFHSHCVNPLKNL